MANHRITRTERRRHKAQTQTPAAPGARCHSDRVYILENGTVRYQGAMRKFLDEEEVRRTYLAV